MIAMSPSSFAACVTTSTPDIAEHEDEPLPVERLEGGGTAVGGEDLVAARPEELPEREADGLLVVDDQDALRARVTDGADRARRPGGRSSVDVAHGACVKMRTGVRRHARHGSPKNRRRRAGPLPPMDAPPSPLSRNWAATERFSVETTSSLQIRGARPILVPAPREAHRVSVAAERADSTARV